MWRTALLAGLAGPGAAALYELGFLTLFRPTSFGNLAAVVAVAAAGLAVGAAAVFRGTRMAGLFCVVLNAAVLALYGFLAFFFLAGASR